jgi:seryl-tRNA synthetase
MMIDTQGVLLNMALINYAMSFLVRRGYTPVQTPFFMRKVRSAPAMLHPREWHGSQLSPRCRSA